MSGGMFDGDLAAVIGDAFSQGYQQFTAATRIRQITTYTDGGDSQTTTVQTPCLAIVSQLSELARKQLGFTNLDQQIIILSTSLGIPFATPDDLTTDDKIMILEGPFANLTFATSSTSVDPAGATITTKGTLA